MNELGNVEGIYREIIEAWNSQEKMVAVLGHRKLVEKAESDVDGIERLRNTFCGPPFAK